MKFILGLFSKETIIKWVAPVAFTVIGAVAGISAERAQDAACSAKVEAPAKK